MNKREYVHKVSKTLYDREDRFPKDESHGNPNLKCTNGWLTGAVGWGTVGKRFNFLSDSTCRFYDRIRSSTLKEDNRARLTSKRDVRRGNRLLRMILIDCGA